jgi:hypothetical protein
MLIIFIQNKNKGITRYRKLAGKTLLPTAFLFLLNLLAVQPVIKR